MAAPSQEYITSSGKKVVKDEVRRTPIFMDQDDIDYLYQFPPVFWKQALMKRYGELLQKAYETRQNGQSISDQQDVTISLSGGGKATFSVDTGINSLLDKLTHDVDNNQYRKLELKDKDSYLQHVKDAKEKEGRDLGYYGFVLSGFSSGKGLRAAKGFVAPDESTVKSALKRWYDAIDEGWFDEEIPEDHRIEDVKVGLGGRGKKISKRFKVFPDVKTWKSKQNKVYESYLPVLMPAVMVRKPDSDAVSVARQARKQIDMDLKSESGVNQYLQIIDPNSPNLINMDKLSQIVTRMSQIEEKLRASKADTDENESLKKELANLQKLAICAELIGGINLGVRAKNLGKTTNPTRQNMKLTPLGIKLKNLLAKASRTENPQQQIMMVIRNFISRLRRSFEFKAQRVISNSERYSIHDWNILHSKGKNPYTNWVGFGTINPNWQQKEVTHGSLQDSIGSEKINDFYKHLLQEVGLKDYVSQGVDAKIRSTKGDPIKDAIREALERNKSMVYDQASDYFMFIAGKGQVAQYSELYKKITSGEKLSPEENSKKADIIDNLKTYAWRQGNNFTGSLAQLQIRFKHPERWNRVFRPQNPGDLATVNSNSYTMEELFRNFYELNTDIHAQTSHEIGVLLARIAQNPDSEVEVAMKDGKSEIEMTDDNKELSNNIIKIVAGTIMGGVRKAIGGVGRMLGFGKKSQDQTEPTQQTGTQTPQTVSPQVPQTGNPQTQMSQAGSQEERPKRSLSDIMNFIRKK
jgi:hypothetical protein